MPDDISALLERQAPAVSDNAGIRAELGVLAHLGQAAACPVVHGFLATHQHVSIPPIC